MEEFKPKRKNTAQPAQNGQIINKYTGIRASVPWGS